MLLHEVEYARPATVEEAVSMLAAHEEPARSPGARR